MEGQDILSAALNECGLQDFLFDSDVNFGIDPSENDTTTTTTTTTNIPEATNNIVVATPTVSPVILPYGSEVFQNDITSTPISPLVNELAIVTNHDHQYQLNQIPPSSSSSSSQQSFTSIVANSCQTLSQFWVTNPITTVAVVPSLNNETIQISSPTTTTTTSAINQNQHLKSLVTSGTSGQKTNGINLTAASTPISQPIQLKNYKNIVTICRPTNQPSDSYRPLSMTIGNNGILTPSTQPLSSSSSSATATGPNVIRMRTVSKLNKSGKFVPTSGHKVVTLTLPKKVTSSTIANNVATTHLGIPSLVAKRHPINQSTQSNNAIIANTLNSGGKLPNVITIISNGSIKQGSVKVLANNKPTTTLTNSQGLPIKIRIQPKAQPVQPVHTLANAVNTTSVSTSAITVPINVLRPQVVNVVSTSGELCSKVVTENSVQSQPQQTSNLQSLIQALPVNGQMQATVGAIQSQSCNGIVNNSNNVGTLIENQPEIMNNNVSDSINLDSNSMFSNDSMPLVESTVDIDTSCDGIFSAPCSPGGENHFQSIMNVNPTSSPLDSFVLSSIPASQSDTSAYSNPSWLAMNDHMLQFIPSTTSTAATLVNSNNFFTFQQQQPQPQSAPPILASTITTNLPFEQSTQLAQSTPLLYSQPRVSINVPKPKRNTNRNKVRRSKSLLSSNLPGVLDDNDSNSCPTSPFVDSNPTSRSNTPDLAQQQQQQQQTNTKTEDQIDNAIMLEEVRKLMEEQDEDEEFANLQTFAEYKPAKLAFGSRHPDQVVETASLSSIPPPDIYYRLYIPDEVMDEGRLSGLQLESIIYASQQHENILPDGSRAGFLIGDGAGVGKGRTVAGIIYENYLRGRKRSLWFSVSNDLKYDAERDLYDIGATRIEVHLLNKFKYGHKIHSPENDNVKRGVIFSTYSSLIGESSSTVGKYSSRFNQLLQWCGEDFEGVIIFDECHKAKNLMPTTSGTRGTKTAQAVLELQRRLPKARVVYASATGATEPRNMGYMTRLGIWGEGTPFDDFNHFVQTVEKRGVGAMELVAIDLKMRGMYMARQLSFKGVTFKIEHVPLSREFIRIYNCCCRLWVSAKAKFEKALDLMGAETQVSKAIWTQFWASHQRFFKYLCIASKVKFAVAFVKEALRANKSIVIGLQSTGESRTIEALDDAGGELNDFVSTAKAVFQSLVEKHFPAPNRKKLAKILGGNSGSSFFDSLGIKLSRNDRDEIVVSYDQDEEQEEDSRLTKAKNFFDSENDSDDDDFVEVNDECSSNVFGDKSDNEDSSDFDSDELDGIDDLCDEKLGLKRKRGGKKNNKVSNAVKFMDILLGPSSAAAKRKPKPHKRPKLPPKPKAPAKTQKKSMRSKYEKFYESFDQVGEDIGGYCERLRDELLQQLESFGERLPPNTLDELIDELGGPEQVAEMTGRKGRIVSTEDGCVQYEARTENDVSLEMLNLVEKQRFMDDDKRVAIISEAASSGISLHADRRAQNRWRRVHITVELPWSADRAIQQFGRTHRSNQVSAPEYVFLISNLAGEKRFASIVAKRLESLGALTHGDRRATESRDLSQFNIDTKFGRQALEIVMKSISGHHDVKPLVPPPERYSGNDFFDDCREGLSGVGLCTIDRRTGICQLEKDYNNINKFLNRILGLEVELQNTLFQYFNDTLEAVIKQAKRSGKYDSGIIDLSSDVGNVQKLNEERFIMKSASGAIKIQLHTVSIDRGISYESAYSMYLEALGDDDYFADDIGFYVSTSSFQIRKTIVLAVPDNVDRSKNVDHKQVFRIYKPNLGLQSKYETKSSLHERGTKLTDLEEAQKLWQMHYEKSDNECTHSLLFGRCRTNARYQAQLAATTIPGSQIPVNMLSKCDVGLRKRTYCILSGSVLTVWPEIEKAIPLIQQLKLQIVRLKTADGLKYIGPMVPPYMVDQVRNCLVKLAGQ